MRNCDARGRDKRLSSGIPIRRIPRPNALSKGKVSTLNRANKVFGSFAKLVRGCQQRLRFGAQLLGPGDESFRGLTHSRIVRAGPVSWHEISYRFFYDRAAVVEGKRQDSPAHKLAILEARGGAPKKPAKRRSPTIVQPRRESRILRRTGHRKA